MALRAAGWDPGSSAAKAALLERTRDGWILREAAVGPAEPAAALWEASRLPRGTVCAAVGSQHVTLREIRHPLTDPARIAETIRFEAEPYLSMPLEQAVLQYRLLGTSEAGSRVLLLAVPKARIGEALAAWRAAGVDPCAVVPDAAALWNCWAAFGPGGEGPGVLLDLGAQKAILAIFAGGELRLLRVLRIALAGPVPTASAAPVPGPAEEGTIVVVEAGEDPVERLQAGVDLLAQEVRRSLATASLEEKLVQVHLTGGGALHPAVPHMLAERLSCPVGRFRLLQKLRHDLPPDRAEIFEALGASAVGAALVAAGQDVVGVDFRREGFRYRGRLQRVAGPLAASALAAAVCLSALALDLRSRTLSWQGTGQRIAVRLEEARSLAVAGVASEKLREGDLADLQNPDVPLQQALERAREYIRRREGSQGAGHDLRSAIDGLNALFTRLPKGTEFTVRKLQAGQGGLTLEGAMADESSIWSLPGAVGGRDSPFEVSPPNAQPLPDGTFGFTLVTKYRP